MRYRAAGAVLGLLTTGVVSGCGADDSTCSSPPVTGTIRYISGSTPPPYHYEWTLQLDSDHATVTMSPGYNSTRTWTTQFVADPAVIQRACRQLAAVGQDRSDSVGGGRLFVELQGATGPQVRVKSLEREPVDWARAIIPDASWNEVEDPHQAWQQAEQDKKRPTPEPRPQPT